MIIVITNRQLFGTPISTPTSIPAREMGVTLGELSSDGDRIYTGVFSSDTNQISFYPKGEEANVFTSVPEEDEDLPWVFFIHGFHQDPQENIDKAIALSKNHKVNVIAFAWPSRPLDLSTGWDEAGQTVIDGVIRRLLVPKILINIVKEKLTSFIKDKWKNYDPAIENAERSNVDLLAALKLVNIHFSSDETPVLLVHSMGNYLLENTMRNINALPMNFDNIILHQADVTTPDYNWVNKLQANLTDEAMLYITSNAYDYVLAASQTRRTIQRKDRTRRLGQNREDYFVNDRIIYTDFTDGMDVEDIHEFFQLNEDSIHSDVFALLGRIFRGERDNLPEVPGASAEGFTRMPTDVLLYRLEKIIDPADLNYDPDTDHPITSLRNFRDPLLPREDPYSEDDNND